MGKRGRREPLPRLFADGYITCPRCRVRTHLLDVERLPEMPLFEDQTVPVYRCRCTFIFAPRSFPVTRS